LSRPAENQLAARGDRWAGWDWTPFTSDSGHQVAVFEKLAG
jgi:hypothetical protein